MERYLEYNKPPDEKERLRDRALAYIDLRMYKEAIAEYEKIIQLDRKNPYWHIDLAITLEESGNIDKSINCYRNAIKLFPNYAALYVNLGYCFGQYLKRPDMAMVCYEKALELDPFDCWALNNIAINRGRAGKPQEALYYLRKAMDAIHRERTKPPYTILHNLAFAYFRCKKYKQALRLYKYLLKNYPDKVSLCTDCACLYYRLSQWERALGLLDNALYEFPDNRHCRRLYKLIRNKIG